MNLVREVAEAPDNGVGEPLSIDDVILDLDAPTKTRVFEVVADHAEQHCGLHAGRICDSLAEREALGSTGLGQGVAIPHARVKGLRHAVLIFARLGVPIPFSAPDGKPVSDMLVLLVPEHANDAHLKILASVAQMLCDPAFRAALRSTDDAARVRELFARGTPA